MCHMEQLPDILHITNEQVNDCKLDKDDRPYCHMMRVDSGHNNSNPRISWFSHGQTGRHESY